VKSQSKLFATEIYAGDNAFVENKLLKVVLVIIGLVGIINYFQVANLIDTSRTVIVFPGHAETAEITGTRASDRYIMFAAEFVAGLYFGATPATVDREFSVLLTLVHPSRFGEMQARLDEEAERLKSYKTLSIHGDVDWSQGFEDTEYQSSTYANLRHVHRLKFTGSRSIYVGANDQESARESRIIVFDYVIENGRFYLLDINLEAPLA
jgi:conjugal transfer pilus assembly protein TraE